MNNVFKKFVEFAFGNGVALLLGLISSPVITRLIDNTDEYGIFSNFNTITSLLCLALLFGLDQAYVRFFYEEKEGNRKELLRECLKIPMIMTVIVGILIIVFYKPVSIFISGEANFKLAILLIIHTFLCILYTFAVLVIRMHQRGKLYSIIQIITKVLYIGFVLVAFKVFGNSYWTLVIGLFTSNAVVLLLSMLFEKKEWKIINRAGELNTSRRELIKFAYPLLFAASISWIFSSIDKIFLNIYATKSDVGLYGSAFSIIALLNACQGAFTTFWVPIANERYVKDPMDTGFFTKMNNYVVVFMSAIGVFLIGGKDIIIFLLGPSYREAVYIIPFLSFMPILYTISEVNVVGINFYKKTKYHIIISVVAASMNALGNFILIPYLGAKGAAISTGACYVVFLGLRTYYSVKLYKVDYNIKKFTVLMISMLALAGYSTLYKLDIVIVILSLFNLLMIGLLYKDTVLEIYNSIISMLKKYKKGCNS